jgi:hypothetical protein
MRRLAPLLALVCCASLLGQIAVSNKVAVSNAAALSAGQPLTAGVVQSTSNCSFGGTSTTTVTVGGSSSTTCPTATGWASNVTAGHIISVQVMRVTGSGTLSTVADGGDTCSVVNTTNLPSTGVVGTSALSLVYGGYCYNVTGGSKPTITLTFTVSKGTWYVQAKELTGVATSAPLDAGFAVGMASTSAGTNAATTGNQTTTTSGDIIDCFSFDDATNGRTFSDGTTSQAWIAGLPLDNTHSESMISEYGVQATASSSTVCAFTVAGGLSNPIVGGMAFKP